MVRVVGVLAILVVTSTVVEADMYVMSAADPQYDVASVAQPLQPEIRRHDLIQNIQGAAVAGNHNPVFRFRVCTDATLKYCKDIVPEPIK